VNSNATSADKQTQLSSFISGNNLGEVFDELVYFHHLVNNNGDQETINYNSNTDMLVVKSDSLSTTFSETFNVDGNVSVSGVPEDTVLVLTSLPKSYATSVPDNAGDQIYFYNIVSSGLSINTGFTLDVELLDQGRSDFDYFLHDYSNNFNFLSEISTSTPNLNFNITNDGPYIISANVDSSSATSETLTALVTELLDNTNNLVELTKSNQFASLLSLGNISTTSNNAFITLQTITNTNTVVSHADTKSPLEISGIPQGNTLLIISVPSSEDINAPENSASDIILFNLYDENSVEVTSGFSLPLTFVGAYNSSATQTLYRLNTNSGSYEEQESIVSSNSAGNLTFTMTSFSSYVLNNETVSSSSSGGGGGGGCLLR
jgi:hypothetical protein